MTNPAAPPPREFANRLRRLRTRLTAEPADALVVFALPNIRYLAGFTGSSAALLVTQDEAVLITDGRYTEQAAEESDHCRILIGERGVEAALPEALGQLRPRAIAFEHAHISVARHNALRTALPRRRWIGCDNWVEDLRLIKSQWELDRIRASVALNDAVLGKVLKRARPSWTEHRLGGEIEAEMRRQGAEKPSFESIVASGSHGSLPHAQPRPVRLVRNSLIVLDHGAILHGYVSDMTRMVCFGAPSPEQEKLFQAVRDAQSAALEKIRSGVRTKSVDLAARKVLAKHGFAEYFTHSTGHGIGLEIHEQPRVSQHDGGTLASNMVITVEPGAYIPGLCGARVEDVVVVRPGGCEVLTTSTRDLVCL